jgi:hypothetical protein
MLSKSAAGGADAGGAGGAGVLDGAPPGVLTRSISRISCAMPSSNPASLLRST